MKTLSPELTITFIILFNIINVMLLSVIIDEACLRYKIYKDNKKSKKNDSEL